MERNLAAKLPSALPAFGLLAEAAVRWVGNSRSHEIEKFRGEADDEDLPILVAAIKAGCDSLITFNVRHYRPAKSSIRIENPGEFLIRLRKHLSQLG